jgi:hypothetical protein
MYKRYLCVIVDAYLRLTFPKRPNRIDSKDVTAFSTTVNHTTYPGAVY